MKTYKSGRFRLKMPTGFKQYTYYELAILIEKAYREGKVKG